MNKRNEELIGNLFLIFVSLIALLFFLFGLTLIMVSLRNIILIGFRFSLIQLIYLMIGIYFTYSSTKNYIKFYKKAIKKPYKVLDSFYRGNKTEIIFTSITSAVLLFIYFNGLYLNYNFVLKMALFFPIFIFQNVIFAVKVFSRATLKPIFLSSVFDLIIPIIEIYYVFVISRLIPKLFYKNNN